MKKPPCSVGIITGSVIFINRVCLPKVREEAQEVVVGD